jgi:predicted transcriptional regulator
MPESTRERQRARRALTAEVLTEVGASLVEIEWRLLHWLLRYPLQRADDLVMGVTRWASQATVYRHLQRLEARGLVESILPKTPGTGKWLYHLSNLGLHMLASHLKRPACELAQSFQANEAGLLRLLPRLPTLLLLQNVVNGLVTGAAEAMTTRGQRPRLVRWTWQRDLTHRFLYREHTMRLFADGGVALCLHAQQDDGSTMDQWYGLLLLATELDDERLMRLRLERLLCYRESPERWPVYQHMLPVLILAASPRQRDHWRRAAEIAALKLRMEPLVGALACLSLEESVHVNPWRLAWHTLSTEVSCHLQDLLLPLPRAAFPSSLSLVESEDEQRDKRASSNTSIVTASPGKPSRLGLLIRGDVARHAAKVAQGELEEREALSMLGLYLTRCMWRMMHLLLAHPLLSVEELAALLDLQTRSARHWLFELHQLGCLEPLTTMAGKRWHLCGRGLRLIAAANHMHVRNIATVPDGMDGVDMPPLVQQGEAWLLQHIRHTAGVYGFFASLARAARHHPGQKLCWWETGAACERRYQVGEQWYNLRPDALAAYRVGSQQARFWLEWDRGTMNMRDLAVKFISYAYYIASREWARECSILPVLVCVAPDIAQERRVQRVAQARLTQSAGLVVRTTTEVLFNEHGPLSPIWLQGLPQCSQAAKPGSLLRQCLFDMIPAKNGM